jgi:hypothetical protein
VPVAALQKVARVVARVHSAVVATAEIVAGHRGRKIDPVGLTAGCLFEVLGLVDARQPGMFSYPWADNQLRVFLIR